MTDGVQEFQDLMQRVRQGNEQASRDLFDRYGPHVLRVVRRRLHKKLRPKYDSDDFVQAVWASFFTDMPEERSFEQPEALVAYLARMAQNKVVSAFRHRLQTAKCDVDQERSLNDSTAFPADSLPARQPTPSQYVMADEEWDRLLARQPPPYRLILQLLREGRTHAEVASAVGINERTVRRLLRKLHPGLGQ
jgi:RNA polymerase sigma-70 factor (ECF subfamily)